MLCIYTSGQHITLLNQWRVSALTPPVCTDIYWKDLARQVGFWGLHLLFETACVFLSFSESTAPLKHWISVNSTRTTSVPSTMNTELFMTGSGPSQRCLFSWAQRSTLSPRGHKSTRYFLDQRPAALFLPKHPNPRDTQQPNTFSCFFLPFQLMEDQILQKYRKYKKVRIRLS